MKHHWFWAKVTAVQHVARGRPAWSLGFTSKLFSKQLEVWSSVFCLSPFIVEIYGVLLNGLFHKSTWFPWEFSSAKFQNHRNSEKVQIISIWKCFCGTFMIYTGWVPHLHTFCSSDCGHFSQDIPQTEAHKLPHFLALRVEQKCRSATEQFSKWEYFWLRAKNATILGEVRERNQFW